MIADMTPATAPAPALRNVYTAEEFAAEILCGNRQPNWVRNQIKARQIKVVASKPYLIPQAEAARFINGKVTLQ
jgi:hypothetical protein